MDLTMMERFGDSWEKNGRILFDRPKPTAGCSASGRRRRKLLCKATNYGFVPELISLKLNAGYEVAQLVEALPYKPEGRGFNSRWCHWNFSFT
jgi:hypothetical protein